MTTFNNPFLLVLKMFLAELTWIRFQEYKYPYKVCTHFTKDLFDAATEYGIRCGCAIIEFEDIRKSHTLNAFETDHGLIYIEPQTGNQEAIEIGRHYPSLLDGVPEDASVSSIQTFWNDKDTIFWLKCNSCEYVIPSSEPIWICPVDEVTDVDLEIYKPLSE